MKTKQRKIFLRISCLALTLMMFMTSGSFAIFASDLSTFANNLVTENKKSTKYMSDVEKLLNRIYEYDSFTDEERQMVNAYLGIGKHTSESSAESKRSLSPVYVAEKRISELSSDGVKYSALSDEDKLVISNYIGTDEYAGTIDSLIDEGYSLFDAVLFAKMLKSGSFTYDQIKRIFKLYPERTERTKKISELEIIANKLDFVKQERAKSLFAGGVSTESLADSFGLSQSALSFEKNNTTANIQSTNSANPGNTESVVDSPANSRPKPITPITSNLSERESVAMNIGSLMYKESLANLPGVNGFDFSLDIAYDSSASNLGRYGDLSNGGNRNLCMLFYDVVHYVRNSQDGTWIEFSRQTLSELCADYDAAYERGLTLIGLLYLEDGYKRCVDKLTYSPVETWLPNTEVLPQTYEELRFGIGSGWSFNIPSIYQGLHLPGVGTIPFDENGFVNYTRTDMTIADSDANDAGAPAGADKVVTFANGTKYYFGSDGLLIRSSDKFGNSINYEYASFDSEMYPCRITDTAGRVTTIAYSNINTGRKIEITAPNQTKTTLYVNRLSDEYGEDNYVLDKIVYPSGEVISFEYEIRGETFTCSKWDDPLDLEFALLKTVTSSNGGASNYEYTSIRNALGASGFVTMPCISRRYSSVGETVSGEKLYTFALNYDRYVEYVGEYFSPGMTDVVYMSVENEVGGMSKRYGFDKNNLCVVFDDQSSGSEFNNFYRTVTKYDSNKYPTLIEESEVVHYNEEYFLNTETRTYDSAGNLLSVVGRGTTVYTYDSDYGMPLTKILTLDENTQIKTVNTLTADKKSVASVSVYMNDSEVSRRSYTYDNSGRILSETKYPDLSSADNKIITSYTYGPYGPASKTMLGVTDADGVSVDVSESYVYDVMGRIVSSTDADGGTTTTAYDIAGRITLVTYPGGNTISYVYDAANKTITVTESGKEAIVYVYDALGNLICEKYSDGTIIFTRTYNGINKAETETSYVGGSMSVKHFVYDMCGNLSSTYITDENGTEIYRQNELHTERGRYQSTILPGDDNSAPVVKYKKYNKYGELVQEGISQSYYREYVRDNAGNVIKIVDYTAINNSTGYTASVVATYTYDALGNMLSETDALGNTRTFTYDNAGRKISESDFKGNVTTYVYDKLDRNIVRTVPFGDNTVSVAKYYYDKRGNTVKEKKSIGADNTTAVTFGEKRFSYNANGKLTDSVTVVSNTASEYTHYEYTAGGAISDIYKGMNAPYSSDAAGNDYSHTHNEYDSKGNPVSATDALGRTESYTYDSAGNRLTVTRRNGTVQRYTYDAAGRVLTDAVYESASSSEASEVKTYAYASTGAVRSVTDGTSGKEYTYDLFGNVLTETEYEYGTQLGQSVYNKKIVKTNTYDKKGRRISFKYEVSGSVCGSFSINSTTLYEYDALGRMSKVIISDTKYTVYAYDANGNKISEHSVDYDENGCGNTKDTVYSYNKSNLVTHIENFVYSYSDEDYNETEDGTVVNSIEYTYYTDGMIRSEVDSVTGTSKSYVYDGARRVVTETDAGALTTFVYDASGNRTSSRTVVDGEVVTAESCIYDKNNQIISRTKNNETILYTYDANGNMITEGNISYTYDARGRQIRVADGSTVVTYAYNLSGLRSEKDTGLTFPMYYVWDGENLVFEFYKSFPYMPYSPTLAPSPLSMYYYGTELVYSGTYGYYLYNASGDVVGIQDSDGKLSRQYSYDTFGNVKNASDSDTNPIRYSGRYFDRETGKYYIAGRYCDLEIYGCRARNGFSKLSYGNNMSAYRFENSFKTDMYALNSMWNPLLNYLEYGNGNNLPDIKTPDFRVYYDLPVYNQHSYSLCWAFCQVMIEDYFNGVYRTNDEATERAIEIAKSILGEENWNNGEWPTNIVYKNFADSMSNTFDLYNALVYCGPIYVYYFNYSTAHLIVLTGVDLLSGEIYTNNPWGNKGIQDYEAFINGFVPMPDEWAMKLYAYHYIRYPGIN